MLPSDIVLPLAADVPSLTPADILGPFGALVLACIGGVALWREMGKRQADRTIRDDKINDDLREEHKRNDDEIRAQRDELATTVRRLTEANIDLARALEADNRDKVGRRRAGDP